MYHFVVSLSWSRLVSIAVVVYPSPFSFCLFCPFVLRRDFEEKLQCLLSRVVEELALTAAYRCSNKYFMKRLWDKIVGNLLGCSSGALTAMLYRLAV